MTKLLFAMAMAVTACGGSSSGSGVDGSLLVVDLTAGEIADECTYLYDNYPAMSTNCGSSGTVTVGEDSISACEDSYNMTIDDSPNCTVTVGEAEDCLADFYDAPCANSLPAACAPLFSADCTGSSARKQLDAAIAHRSGLQR